MSAATWDDLGPEARVLRDVMRSRAFSAVSGEAGPQETQGTCHVADAAARRLAARREAAAPANSAAPARGDDVRPASPTVDAELNWRHLTRVSRYHDLRAALDACLGAAAAAAAALWPAEGARGARAALCLAPLWADEAFLRAAAAPAAASAPPTDLAAAALNIYAAAPPAAAAARRGGAPRPGPRAPASFAATAADIIRATIRDRAARKLGDAAAGAAAGDGARRGSTADALRLQRGVAAAAQWPPLVDALAAFRSLAARCDAVAAEQRADAAARAAAARRAAPRASPRPALTPLASPSTSALDYFFGPSPAARSAPATPAAAHDAALAARAWTPPAPVLDVAPPAGEEEVPGDLDYYDSQEGALAAPPAPRDADDAPAPIDDDDAAPAPMSDDDDAFVSVTQSQSQDEAPPPPAAPRTTTKKQRARKKPAAKKKRKPAAPPPEITPLEAKRRAPPAPPPSAAGRPPARPEAPRGGATRGGGARSLLPELDAAAEDALRRARAAAAPRQARAPRTRARGSLLDPALPPPPGAAAAPRATFPGPPPPPPPAPPATLPPPTAASVAARRPVRAARKRARPLSPAPARPARYDASPQDPPSTPAQIFPSKLRRIVEGFGDYCSYSPTARKLVIPDRARFAERVLPKFFKAAPGAAPAARRKTMWESFQRQMNYYSWFAERGRAGGDAFVCADPAVRHAADFERRLRRRSTQYR